MLLGLIGYFTARLVLPIVTFGLVGVSPIFRPSTFENSSGDVRGVSNYRFECEAFLGSRIGMAIWAAILGVYLIFCNWSR